MLIIKGDIRARRALIVACINRDVRARRALISLLIIGTSRALRAHVVPINKEDYKAPKGPSNAS